MTPADVRREVRQEILRLLDEAETAGDLDEFVASLRDGCLTEEAINVGPEPVDHETTTPRRRLHQLAVDRDAETLEAEAVAEPLIEFSKRKVVGMSDSLAAALARKETGIDLTPTQFQLPSPQSYFKRRPSDMKWGWVNGEQVRVADPFDGEAFEKAFLDRLKAGEAEAPAYVAVCSEFGVPSLPKGGSLDRVLAELPEAGGGGFGMGREEAGRALKKAGLLGRFGRRLLGVGDKTDEEGDDK